MNPKFGRYRKHFINVGFDVVDCPRLTKRGKNSADMKMTLEVSDQLSHQSRYDEFILMSGDTDFIPVLMRVREHNRFSSVVASTYVARSLKSVTDLLVTEQEFVDSAIMRKFRKKPR